MHSASNRRAFLGTLASVTGLTTLAALRPTPSHATLTPGSEWDLAWIKEFKGKHRQVFAADQLPGHLPLFVVGNYLDAHEEVHGLSHPDINTVMAVARAFPINAGHALWDKYELGRLWELKDPQTGEWARRSIYLERMPGPPDKHAGVKPLQARGTVFYQCNNAVNGVASRLAKEFGKTVEDVRADLLAGMNPGVKLVPAHTMVLGLLQENGFTYEQIS